MAIAVSSGVWFAGRRYPRFVPMPENITEPVEFSQCFDVFLSGAGRQGPVANTEIGPFYWDVFHLRSDQRARDRAQRHCRERCEPVLVPYARDRIAVSDIADYVAYDWTISDFQVNAGEADDLVRVFPWQQNQVICFKRHSIFRVTGVSGDLSTATLEKLPGSVGLVGRHAVCDVSGDIYFMSHSGVFKMSQVMLNTPQADEMPVTDSIKPIIDSINWNAASLICCGYRRDRVYFAVPLKNSVRNNCIIVYNIATGCWESLTSLG
jgi:hypothetical protein